MKLNVYSGTMCDVIDLDDLHVSGIVTPDSSELIKSLSDDSLLEVIKNPIGSAKLNNLIDSEKKISIVVDDATRPTPTRRMLKVLMEYLNFLGATASNITFTVATGLHRPSTWAEKVEIFGNVILRDYDVADNEARNTEVHGLLGTNSLGKDLYINKRILNADIVITLGLVKSHAFAGFTGGAKSILPGISSQNTILQNHSFKNIEYPRGVLGSCELSGTRKEMEEAAKFVDPFIFNVVLDGKGEIIYATAGDVIHAHRKAVEFYSRTAMKTVPDEVDIAVVYGGYAGSVNFYQALFGCNVVKTTERPILKKNGTVILYAECREGSGSKLFESMLPRFSTPEEVLQHLASNKVVDDQWAVQFLATFLRDINVYVVSSGLTKELAEILKVHLYESVQSAIEDAISMSPRDYKIAVIENPDVLVVNKRV